MVINHPAAARNAEAIFSVLREQLSEQLQRASRESAAAAPQRVLELASGPGQHVELFAGRLPLVQFQPSEPQAEMRASIDERVRERALTNVAPALSLDAREAWPAGPFDLVLAVNLLHISPWDVAGAVVQGAAKALKANGCLMLYGPYRVGGEHTSDGNVAFDADLRARNPAWGIRDLEAVAELGQSAGLGDLQQIPMPANNFSLLLTR